MKVFLHRIQIPMSYTITGLFGSIAFWYSASSHMNSLNANVQSVVYIILAVGAFMTISGIFWMIKIAQVSFGPNKIEYSADEDL